MVDKLKIEDLVGTWNIANEAEHDGFAEVVKALGGDWWFNPVACTSYNDFYEQLVLDRDHVLCRINDSTPLEAIDIIERYKEENETMIENTEKNPIEAAQEHVEKIKQLLAEAEQVVECVKEAEKASKASKASTGVFLGEGEYRTAIKLTSGMGKITHVWNQEGFGEFGSLYKTEELAGKAAKQLVRYQRLLNYVIHHDQDWTADWEDDKQSKFYVDYIQYDGAYGVDYLYSYEALGTVYMSEECARALIEKLNNKTFSLDPPVAD